MSFIFNNPGIQGQSVIVPGFQFLNECCPRLFHILFVKISDGSKNMGGKKFINLEILGFFSKNLFVVPNQGWPQDDIIIKQTWL
jgi:hypothetical protein